LKQTDHSALSINLLADGAGHTFFEQSVFEGEIGHDLLQRLRLATMILHLVGGRGARRVAGKPFLAGLQELLRPSPSLLFVPFECARAAFSSCSPAPPPD
jgi:hypothetical protein